MNIDDIKKMVEEDVKIDRTNLDYESSIIPQQHNKYLCFLMDEKLKLAKYEADLNVLRKNKWLYYSGKLSEEELSELDWEPFELNIMKTDVEKFLISDRDLINLSLKIAIQSEKVNYLESVVKLISNKIWTIRASIDWIKFTQGIV
jgi:hypothetical protein